MKYTIAVVVMFEGKKNEFKNDLFHFYSKFRKINSRLYDFASTTPKCCSLFHQTHIPPYFRYHTQFLLCQLVCHSSVSYWPLLPNPILAGEGAGVPAILSEEAGPTGATGGHAHASTTSLPRPGAGLVITLSQCVEVRLVTDQRLRRCCVQIWQSRETGTSGVDGMSRVVVREMRVGGERGSVITPNRRVVEWGVLGVEWRWITVRWMEGGVSGVVGEIARVITMQGQE